MKKIFSLVAILAVMVISIPEAKAGLIYSNITSPVTATGAKSHKSVRNLKKGTSSANSILFGMFTMGDAGIEKAAYDAGIKQVHYIDKNFKNYLLIFMKETTTVYGE